MKRTFLLTVIFTLVACQTEPGVAQTSQAVVSKGNFHSLSAHKNNRRATQRTCWKKVRPRKSPNQRQTFILATGANTGKLQKANQDARQFKRAMQKRFKVPDNQVCFFDDVYRAEFEQALIDLRRWVKQNDLVIIFFSGHGSYVEDDDGDEPKKTRPERYDDVLVTKEVVSIDYPDREDVVTDDRLVVLVNALKTRRILTFLDACFSSGMFMGPKPHMRAKFFRKGSLGPPKKLSFNFGPIHKTRRLADLAHLRGVVFAAAQEYQKAWENPKKGGIFTITFLKELKRQPHANLKRIFNKTKSKLQQPNKTPEPQNPEMMGDARLAEKL